MRNSNFAFTDDDFGEGIESFETMKGCFYTPLHY